MRGDKLISLNLESPMRIAKTKTQQPRNWITIHALFALAACGGDDSVGSDGGGTTAINDLLDPSNVFYGSNNSIAGTSSDDNIIARETGDTISAGAGNDVILTGGGNDTVNAEEGDDRITVSSGTNTVKGGTGTDTLTVSDAAADIAQTAAPSFGNGTLTFGAHSVTYTSVELILSSDGYTLQWGSLGGLAVGGSGNDYMRGSDSSEALQGNDGDDVLLGGDGVDELIGGAGNDTLDGQGGTDILNGGAGNDILTTTDGPGRMNGGDGNDTFHTVSNDTGTLYVNGGGGTDKLIIELGYTKLMELFGTTYLQHSTSNHNIQYSSIEEVVDTAGDPYIF